MQSQTNLALAVAFNGTMLDSRFMAPAALPHLVLAQIEDWFRLENGVEGLDRTAVIADIQAATYNDLLQVLGRIGFRAVPQEPDQPLTYMVEIHLWEEAIDRWVAEWRTTEPNVPQKIDWLHSGF